MKFGEYCDLLNVKRRELLEEPAKEYARYAAELYEQLDERDHHVAQILQQGMADLGLPLALGFTLRVHKQSQTQKKNTTPSSSS